VAGCCSQSEYRRFFNRKAAAKDARRFRKRGLTGTALTLTRLAGDVRGATVLDIGGGLGAIELELLESGAARATSIELSGAYEDEAAMLLGERGLDARVQRRIGDFVVDASSIEPHDVVVLHRVICCYPDMEALVGEAADHARRTLLLTYPQDRAVVRAGVRAVNLVLRISRCGFRTYAHRVDRILAVAAEHGLALQTRRSSGVLWETVALGRPDA
jgi:2-polyprenyl-3-methyl-5-hydroxy-6-metoxy-1,4-benzoquinol methylase